MHMPIHTDEREAEKRCEPRVKKICRRLVMELKNGAVISV